MATDIVQSLFGVTPDMYQQQQARQADARALQFAQLTPMQQAQYGIGRGAYGLAGAIGGALGAQDPELQRISARNSIAQQINYNNPESIMQGVEALSQAGDTVGAMQLATIARDLEYKQAQTSQSLAAGQASLAQAAKAARDENTVVVGNALVDRRTGQPIYRAPDGETKPVVVGNALINPATGQEIYRAPEGAPKPVVVGNALINPATGQEVYRTPEAAPKPVVVGNALINPATGQEVYRTPEGAPKPVVVGNALVNPATGQEVYRASKDVVEPTTPELTNARAIALRAGPVGSPEYNAALDAEYKRLTAKTDSDVVVVGNALVSKSTGKPIYEGSKPEKYSAFAQELIDAGLTPGTAPFEKRMLEYVAGKTKGAERGVGNVSIGGITIDTGAAAKAAGTIVGQGVANIENQYSMLTAFNDAVSLVDQGIYGGAYGPEQAAATKYSLGLLGNKKKLENTEVFLANIGEIVIPRLQQFGGNDSNEELKYLQKVVAGDQRLEPAAVKRILMSAEKKVRNNIARLQKQAGGELPTGPVTPAAAASAPTKRYNPQTRKIEPISGN